MPSGLPQRTIECNGFVSGFPSIYCTSVLRGKRGLDSGLNSYAIVQPSARSTNRKRAGAFCFVRRLQKPFQAKYRSLVEEDERLRAKVKHRKFLHRRAAPAILVKDRRWISLISRLFFVFVGLAMQDYHLINSYD